MKWKKSESGVLKPGDTFERYTVEKLLGRGGMGAVYLVRHNILESLFALKVLFPEVASKNRQFVDRFIREAKLACKIKHPNLIAVHDAGKNPKNGMYYIIMDYVSGGSIRDLLKKNGRISSQRAISIVEQIASALETAKQHHMVHRDIKPDNIMFAADGTAKLADLGIAKSTNEQDTMLTMEVSVFGTPAYMSPEQAMDSSKVDCRADIYSLGIVLFEMLSGQRPYRGSGTMEILSQVVKDDNIPDIRKYCPQLSSEIAELIRDMTAKHLEERIATPTELLKRIHAISLKDIAWNTVAAKPSADTESTATMPTMVRTTPAEHSEVTLQTVTVSTVTESKDIPVSEPTMPTRAPETPEQQTATAQYKQVENKDLQPEITTTIPMAKIQHPALTQQIETRSGKFADKKKIVMVVVSAVLVCFICISILFMLSARKNNVSTTEVMKKKELSVTPKTSPVKTAADTLQAETSENEKLSLPIAAEQKSKAEYLSEDELVSNAVVILGNPGKDVQSLKTSIAESGKFPVVFREAEIFARYREQLSEIIKSKPKYVILIPSVKYAELKMSRANFETLIHAEAEMLRDSQIPFIFVLSSENLDVPRIAQFNEAVMELCNRRSFPVIAGNKDIRSFIK